MKNSIDSPEDLNRDNMPKPMAQRTPEAKQDPNVSPWVKAFVLFHVFAIVVWSLPRPPQESNQVHSEPWGNGKLIVWNNEYLQQSPLKYYLQCTGLWQYWDMFAPDPMKVDVYLDANVTYRDGSKSVYRYPRMADLNLWDRYQGERYRKFFERINGDNLGFLWGPVAARIAKQVNNNGSNPPTEVQLVRHWRAISPPGQPQSEEYKSAVFFTSQIDHAMLSEKP